MKQTGHVRGDGMFRLANTLAEKAPPIATPNGSMAHVLQCSEQMQGHKETSGKTRYEKRLIESPITVDHERPAQQTCSCTKKFQKSEEKDDDERGKSMLVFAVS